jgi:hypothetical protein
MSTYTVEDFNKVNAKASPLSYGTHSALSARAASCYFDGDKPAGRFAALMEADL